MVWVGHSGDESHSKQKLSNQKSASDGLWVPLESVVDRGEIMVDFDAVVRNVEQLNVIAGEGKSQVTTTPNKCAKLKVGLIHKEKSYLQHYAIKLIFLLPQAH